ncbi:DUF1553 domain-containing protein [Blastopirellula marina]|uniref:Planctomycete cytochrome C n=1 Tax=Blastopirellula marina DSM 3645 TaxID=314230 RepID=A3ZN17_9BACT|nr:DUF1553 domain-containing protein [Blastopirellula marina]EAQ82346.1 hypothetical protein DSM3645_01490 [Blastopirellula marina DSM 3645]
MPRFDRFCGMMALPVLLLLAGVGRAKEPIDFNRDIRPLLSGNCFHCHGPDPESREAGLRLDQRDGAVAELDSGSIAVVPGKPDDSELLARLTGDDFVRMPPPESGKQLTPAEVDLFRRWIAEGAEYQRHWSFEPPVQNEPPTPPSVEWAKNPLDRFVLQKLHQQNLTPAVEADRATLLRRVSLALIGLPPTLEEIDAFVADADPDAYEKVVDRLLADPAYGERWARPWLDIARYADSAGYAQDPERNIWKYRDWVIQSLNANQPFDQFTIDQLAGDMLPNPTEDQLIATAFHRNTMTNSEGGTNDEEFRNAAIVDRVNTTLQAWMGLTMECAQCHTHKYDPISHEEYFRFFAIFNQSADADRGDESPNHESWTAQQTAKKESLAQRLKAAQQALKTLQESTPAPPTIPTGPLTARYVRIENLGEGKILSLAEVQVIAGGENIAPRGAATQAGVAYEGAANLAIDGITDGDYFNAKSTTHTERRNDPWWELDLQEAIALEQVVLWNRTDGDLFTRLAPYHVILLDEKRQPIWGHQSDAPFASFVEFAIPKTGEELDDAAKQAMAKFAATERPEITAKLQEIEKLEKQLAAVRPTKTPIMQELAADKQRETFIQIRGSYQVRGDKVEPGVLGEFHPLPADAKADRLGAARWIVARENPLTARVAVNRLWEQLFGVGLVETSEDFGSQGELPVNQPLLDYLAVDLMEHGWDIKRTIKLMVESAAYRQAAIATPEKLAIDPANRLVSRGPRFRLSAEMVRDSALAASGLLSRKMNGPSVRPVQPKMGMRAAFGGSTDWEPSTGEDRYRRGLYTKWRRTTPYPSMMAFDATSREVCTIRRIATNTPLQALVTLNDPVYVEAAQALARRIVADGGSANEDRVAYGFRLCLSRQPTPAETTRLVQLLEAATAQYREQPEQAKTIATEPIGPLPQDADAAELAAWTLIGNVLMNLDEFLSR